MEIRITKDELIFPTLGKNYKQVVGVSVAANMREALKEYDVKADEAVVYLDTPLVLMPESQLEEEDYDQLYRISITPSSGEEIVVLKNELSELDVAFLFSVSKDLMTVIEDNFQQYSLRHAVADMFHEEKLSGYKEKKLYAYFYDKKMYAYAFKQNRLLFFNEYEAGTPQDYAFLLLSVFKQLGYAQLKDEIVVCGELLFKEELLSLLSEFVKNVSEMED